MLAITWSNPSNTKANTGHQMATTLEKNSRAQQARKQARQTSQLAPMALRKIWYQAGVTAFAVAMAKTSFFRASDERTPLWPMMMPTMKRAPARLPRKVRAQ